MNNETHNAEQALLGACMIDPDLVMPICQDHKITPESFDLPDNKLVFTAILRLAAKGKGIDAVTVADQLAGAKIPPLTDMIDACVASAHAPDYARIVAEADSRRRTTLALEDAIEQLRGTDATAADVAAGLNASLTQLTENNMVKIKRIKDIMPDKFAQWEQAKNRGFVGVPTGIQGLDSILGGWRPGVLGLIAGYRGEGKSTLMRQKALWLAQHEYHVALFSLEDPEDIAAANIVGNEASVSVLGLDTGCGTAEDFAEMMVSYRRTADLPLDIVGQPLTIDQICTTARRIHSRHKLDILFGDHIQFIKPLILPRMSRNDTLSAHTQSLVSLARELGIPVVWASQLSRDAEKQGRKPRLSDLRDSGALEQDARQVLILYWDNESECFKLEVAKNNYGKSRQAIAMHRRDGKQRFEVAREAMRQGVTA